MFDRSDIESHGTDLSHLFPPRLRIGGVAVFAGDWSFTAVAAPMSVRVTVTHHLDAATLARVLTLIGERFEVIEPKHEHRRHPDSAV